MRDARLAVGRSPDERDVPPASVAEAAGRRGAREADRLAVNVRVYVAARDAEQQRLVGKRDGGVWRRGALVGERDSGAWRRGAWAGEISSAWRDRGIWRCVAAWRTGGKDEWRRGRVTYWWER